MKHVNINDVPACELGLPGAKGVTVRLLIGGDEAPGFVMLFLELAPGGHTPGHSHEWEEEVFVTSGTGSVKTREGERPLKAGDQLLRVICVIPKRG